MFEQNVVISIESHIFCVIVWSRNNNINYDSLIKNYFNSFQVDQNYNLVVIDAQVGFCNLSIYCSNQTLILTHISIKVKRNVQNVSKFLCI